MAKAKISKKLKASKAKSLKRHRPFVSDELVNSSTVVQTLLECIQTGDLNSFQEVLTSHLITVNKAQFVKKAGISRRTLYSLIDPNKKFNPELETISSIIRSIAS